MRRRGTVITALLAVLVSGLTWAGVADAATPGTTLVGAASGRCLDVYRGSTTAGTPLIVWDCHGTANQRWTLPSDGTLRVFAGSRCAQPAGGSTARGVAVEVAACTGSPAQRWTLTSGGTLVNAAASLCLDVLQARTAAGSAVGVWTCHGRGNQTWRRGPDTTPPTSPTALRASGLSCSAVTLDWSAASDDVAVTAYDVFHDGQLVTSVAAAPVTVAVTPGVAYGWYVDARDAAGNVSQASPTLTVTPPRCGSDTTPPSAPTSLTATVDGTSVTLGWRASSDDVGVTAYVVARDGATVATVPGGTTAYTDSGLAPLQRYSWTVRARDAAGNVSAASAAVTATTGRACSSAICGVTEVARDSDIPWGLVTLPDGSVLYARRDAHQVVRLDPATGTTTSLGTLPGVESTGGEGGLLGLAVSPSFASDHWLYVMHSTATDNRIVRVPYTGGKLDVAGEQVLLTGILRNKYHNGGRLRFGPDGMLYASTGDAQNGAYAQRLTGTGSLNGKVLRLTPTGGVPADNPFGSYVWSYGHRNPQGLAFDAQGRLWEQEFGNNVMDETNLIARGGNYGWPQCEGTTGAGCSDAGLVAPKQTYPVAEGSCSGIAVVRGALYVACARGQRLYREVISGTSLTDRQQLLVGTYGRLRTVEPAADGGLWLTTTNLGDKDSTAGNSDERVLHVALGG
ncbi:glucose/arabinose dehydrogenase [Motilibacter peucedani]|uniref:Glucose/arabinose dehydrogenase n=1 Tax=Motilibacter peucedani TaxID=598650 RepID=A0A420XNU4_9ACTN|nr:PQQ-dependent sugar dehydrogenase [Motilibacter peucedani]RKS73842.1 glucose/arabinose dehydrogenase [Motilibacter peucedani]